MKKTGKNIHEDVFRKNYFFLLFLFFFPGVQQFFRKDTLPNLVGVTLTKEKPEWSRESWFSGFYQEQTEEFNNDNWAWKEPLVQWNNQLYYSLFNIIRVNGFVAGLNHYVFSESYIFSAYGDDLMPEEKISGLIRKAEVISDSLKKYQKKLVLVLGPGKGVMCPEYIESKYKHPVSSTNHQQFLKALKKTSLSFLDLYTWFLKIQPESPYPLFTTYGHHWSYYAECLAVDTLIRFLEKHFGKKIPHIRWNQISLSDTARHRDADVLPSMNLMLRPPQYQKLAYPEIFFDPYTDPVPVRVLVVSDSYWYGPVYMGVPQKSFGGGSFWYYYNKVVPSPRPGEKVEVWELDLKQEVMAHDILMIFYSDANLTGFGNGIIEDLYEMFTAPEIFHAKQKRKKEIQFYARQIRESPVLMKKALYRSGEERQPVDTVIQHMAMELLKKNQSL